MAGLHQAWRPSRWLRCPCKRSGTRECLAIVTPGQSPNDIWRLKLRDQGNAFESCNHDLTGCRWTQEGKRTLAALAGPSSKQSGLPLPLAASLSHSQNNVPTPRAALTPPPSFSHEQCTHC